MKDKRVFLVSCVSSKRDESSRAKDLYTSPWFVKARRYAEAQQAPWFILSAEHGLVKPDTVLAPYEKTLNTMGAQARRQWASNVLDSLEKVLSQGSTVIFLAGQKYRENLVTKLQAAGHRIEIPMKGLGIGQQLQWLTQQNAKEPDVNVTTLLSWSPWYDLNGASRNPAIPRKTAGLYRIRRVGFDGLDYIGQTGASNGLRGRMGNLLGVFKDEMPYRDPHTAGPALWALRQTGSDLEVSVCPVEGSTPWRKGLEALATSLYRQKHGGSPTVNFGRMPTGYRMSSANNSRLAEAGNKYRGGPTLEDDKSHFAGISPVGLLSGSPASQEWCGHFWSPWASVSALGAVQGQAAGLYRIRAVGADVLLYIGEGKIRDRLHAHFKKMDKDGHTQGQVFREVGGLEFSWVEGGGWLKHHLLELENDLIAAHLLETEQIPAAQFLG